jgi:hypothetical protein
MHLTINRISDTDEGDYFCHAENAFGSSTRPVSVRIRNVVSIVPQSAFIEGFVWLPTLVFYFLLKEINSVTHNNAEEMVWIYKDTTLTLLSYRIKCKNEVKVDVKKSN